MGHLPSIFATVALTSLLLCACGDKLSPSGGDSPVVLRAIELEDAPSYATCDVRDGHLSVGAAGAFCAFEVLVFLTSATEPYDPIDEDALAVAGHPQGVHVDTDSTGKHFLLVACVDYENDVSRLDLFRDTSGNELPDESSLTTLKSLPGSHFFTTAYDRGSSTLYVADGLGGRVFRMSDTNSDGVPDASSWTEFVSDGGAAGPTVDVGAIGNPTESSVRLFSTFAVGSGPVPDTNNPQKYILLEDTDADGVADVGTPHEPGPSPCSTFAEMPRSGATEVTIDVHSNTEFRVEAVDANLTTEILGTATGAPGVHTVSLSRPLVAGEVLSIWDVSGGESLATAHVVASDRTTAYGFEDSISLPEAGDSIKILGNNFSGTETVEALQRGAASWTSCVVTAWAADELTVTFPDLGLDRHRPVMFRVETAAGDTYMFSILGGK
jgi:hypothetical protein